MDDMDERVWEVIVCDLRESCGAVCPGSARGEDCYYYAEVVADAEARRTVTEAQNNKSKLGYWRDVATGLSSLVDELSANVTLWRTAWIEMCTERDSALAEVNLKRPATLDTAEAALANCGLTGIYDQFSGPADAIEQMVQRLVQLEGGQALQNERQLRQEAEQRVEALTALVNEGTAELLEQMADYAREAAHAAKGCPDDVDAAYIAEETARALAAKIREALEKGKEV